MTGQAWNFGKPRRCRYGPGSAGSSVKNYGRSRIFGGLLPADAAAGIPSSVHARTYVAVNRCQGKLRLPRMAFADQPVDHPFHRWRQPAAPNRPGIRCVTLPVPRLQRSISAVWHCPASLTPRQSHKRSITETAGSFSRSVRSAGDPAVRHGPSLSQKPSNNR